MDKGISIILSLHRGRGFRNKFRIKMCLAESVKDFLP